VDIPTRLGHSLRRVGGQAGQAAQAVEPTANDGQAAPH